MPVDAKPIAKDVVFIFDKSGSMDAKRSCSQGRPQVRHRAAQPEYRFNLLYTATTYRGVQHVHRRQRRQHYRHRPRGEEKLTADGGTTSNTALGQRLGDVFMGIDEKGSNSRPSYAIFMTDGQPTVGETGIDKIISNARTASRRREALCLCVGNDVNTTLLDSLSYAHHGSASYVSEDEDIEVKVSSFYAKMSSPALTNLALDLDG